MFVKNKYGYKISTESMIQYLVMTKNNVYKLLPLREEGSEWEKYLNSLLELELKGCERLFSEVNFIALISKLESLYNKNFYLYRKGVFESLKIIDKMIEKLEGEIDEE